MFFGVVMKTWRWSFCIDVGEVDNADDVNDDEPDYKEDNSDEQNARLSITVTIMMITIISLWLWLLKW